MEEHWQKQFENHSKCSRKLSLEQLRKFQSEWSDIVLKNTSKGMKWLMVLIKLIQVFVRWAILTSGCRPKMNIWVFEEYPDVATYHSFRKIIKTKDSLWHIKILVFNTRDLVSWCFDILPLFAPPTHVHRYRKLFCTCKDGTYHLESVES